MTPLALTLAAVVLVAAAIWWAAQRARHPAMRRRVVVNKRDGSAVTGVLWRHRGRLLIVRDAALVEPGAEPLPMDGEAIVDRDMIDFIQVRP